MGCWTRGEGILKYVCQNCVAVVVSGNTDLPHVFNKLSEARCPKCGFLAVPEIVLNNVIMKR